MAALLIVSLTALNAIKQTSSCLTWSFGRNDALAFSKFISHVHLSLEVPVYALLLNGFAGVLIGFLFLVSSTGDLTSASSRFLGVRLMRFAGQQ